AQGKLLHYLPTRRSSDLNFGKIRASYAEVGKDASPYLIGNYYSTSTPFRGIAGVERDGTIGSETLKPERTKAYEFGVDLGFFGRSEEHTSELQSRENLVC